MNYTFDSLKKWIVGNFWNRAEVAGFLSTNYFRRAIHRQTSDGAVHAALPVILDSGGQLDGSLIDDDGYALLAGRASGQTLNGGTAANEDLTLEGTAHATKATSVIFMQPTTGWVSIGPTPTQANRLVVEETTADTNPATFGFTATDAATPRGNNFINRDQTANSAGGFRLDMTDNSGNTTRGAAIVAGKEQLFTTTVGTRDGYLALMVALNGLLVEYLRIASSGNVGVNKTVPTGQLHVAQSSTTGAKPTVVLEQLDVSEEFIEFVTTIGIGNSVEAVGAKTLTTTHFIKVKLPGGLIRYIPAGTIA